MQRETCSDGVPLEEIKYFLGRLHETQMLNHTVSLSLKALTTKAGCKINDENAMILLGDLNRQKMSWNRR